MAQNVRVAAPRPHDGTTIVPCCGRRPSPSFSPPPPPSLPPARARVGAGGISPSSSAFISPPFPRRSLPSPLRPAARSFLFPPVSPADSTYSSTASYACLFPRALTNSDLRERRNGVTSRCLRRGRSILSLRHGGIRERIRRVHSRDDHGDGEI